jgi:hypothetical protein
MDRRVKPSRSLAFFQQFLHGQDILQQRRRRLGLSAPAFERNQVPTRSWKSLSARYAWLTSAERASNLSRSSAGLWR